MRVTHVAPTAFGAAGLFGGGERYPLELARALARDVDTELITFGRSNQRTREASGLRIRTVHAVSWLGGHPAHPFAPSLPIVLAKSGIVHTHHMRSLPSKMAALSARGLGAMLAVTDHGLQGSDWGGRLQRLFDHFLTVSAYSARELRAPSRRTRVIYGGADATRYFPDFDIARAGVLFVGRLTPHKGVDRLIEALPAGALLRVVGTGGHDAQPPERDYPRLLRELARERSVEFLGSLADSDLPLAYRSAKVFVLPSLERTRYGRTIAVSELLGLSVLEAMASGTPVVASRVGGVMEIVRDGETGFLVPPGDATALRDRLNQLLHDDALAARIGANARQEVIEHFTWSKVAERCLEAYAVSFTP